MLILFLLSVLGCILHNQHTFGELTIYKTGWLDRVVQWTKERFFADVKERLPPIEFKVTLEKAPPGFKDSEKWDFNSVARLLYLIRTNGKNRKVMMALRRSLGSGRRSNSNRRISMSKQESYKFFPAIEPDVAYEDSYYEDEAGAEAMDDSCEVWRDIQEGEKEDKNGKPGKKCVMKKEKPKWDDNTIITISNPVEARMPSQRVSVGLIREILELRALAARVMPGDKVFEEEDQSTTTKKKPPSTSATTPDNNDTTTDATSNASDDNATEETSASDTGESTTPTEESNSTDQSDDTTPTGDADQSTGTNPSDDAQPANTTEQAANDTPPD